VDLNKLIICHQMALHEMTDGMNHEVRRWAGARADYYAERILAARAKMGSPIATFRCGGGC